MSEIVQLIDELKRADPESDEQFRRLVQRSMCVLGIDDATMAHEFDMSRPSVLRWRNGCNMPHPRLRPHVYQFFVRKAQAQLDLKRKARWWVMHVIHNCVAHPLLVLAELAELNRVHTLQRALYRFHDITVPEGDTKNRLRLLEKQK